MGKDKKKELPRKGNDAVKFIEKNAEVIQKRQEGSHVFMRVKAKGKSEEAVIVVTVHGNQEMSTGVWHKIKKQLLRIGVLSVIVLGLALVFQLMSLI